MGVPMDTLTLYLDKIVFALQFNHGLGLGEKPEVGISVHVWPEQEASDLVHIRGNGKLP